MAKKKVEVKKEVEVKPKKVDLRRKRSDAITSASIQKALLKIQSDNELLIKRKISKGERTKIDLVVKNRLRVLLSQLDRFGRLDKVSGKRV